MTDFLSQEETLEEITEEPLDIPVEKQEEVPGDEDVLNE